MPEENSMLAQTVEMSVLDARALDEVVHELGIESSDTSPAEAVKALLAEIERLRREHGNASQITDEQVDRAFQAFVASCNEMAPCPRCEGRGYHHGFGEHGHDPDWCEQCGGSQFVAARDYRESMRLALAAALSLQERG